MRSGGQARLKPWRISGAKIPLFTPFRSSDACLSRGEVRRLSEEGFLEKVNQSKKGNTWKATGKLTDYAKKNKNAPVQLPHSTDINIFELIKTNPGKTTNELMALTGECRWTVLARANRLIKLNLIKSKKIVFKRVDGMGGSYTYQYYPVDSVLPDGKQKILLDIIKAHPGKKSSELAALMGESKKATLNRIKILKSWGRILVKRKTVKRKENAVHYYSYYIKGVKACRQ